jgi:DNA-binding MarR family transcriptional regulator
MRVSYTQYKCFEGAVKVQNTRNVDKLASALIDLMSLLSSPQRDEALLREAGVSLDRALFPLLVFLDARGPLGVAELADQVGRDHTTISRQLPKLETMKLVERRDADADRRKRSVSLTVDGKRVVQAITLARRRALTKALAGWTPVDREALADLSRRFVDCLSEIAR